MDGHFIYGLDSGKRRKIAISQDNPYGALEKESDDLHGQIEIFVSQPLGRLEKKGPFSRPCLLRGGEEVGGYSKAYLLLSFCLP